MASESITNSTLNLRDPLVWGNIKGKLMTPIGFMVELQLLNVAFGTGNKFLRQSGYICCKNVALVQEQKAPISNRVLTAESLKITLV